MTYLPGIQSFIWGLIFWKLEMLELEMNEPSVSLETLAGLTNIEIDKAMEKIMRKHGFTGTDVSYVGEGVERRLIISDKAFDYIAAHKDAMESEIMEAIKTATGKAFNIGLEIIELQKIVGKA